MGWAFLHLSARWRQGSGVHFPMLTQAFRHRDGYEGTNQGRASLEPDFPGELSAMLLRHVAEKGMDEGIREVGNAGKIEDDRFDPAPDTFDVERAELVAQVSIGEEFAEFGDHVDFQFHKFDGIRGMRRFSIQRLPVGHYAPVPTRPQSKIWVLLNP